MSSQYEEWFYIKDDNVYYHGENDGFAFMRKGAEAVDILIGPVEGVELLLRSMSKHKLYHSLRDALNKHEKKEITWGTAIGGPN